MSGPLLGGLEIMPNGGVFGPSRNGSILLLATKNTLQWLRSGLHVSKRATVAQTFSITERRVAASGPMTSKPQDFRTSYTPHVRQV